MNEFLKTQEVEWKFPGRERIVIYPVSLLTTRDDLHRITKMESFNNTNQTQDFIIE